MTSTTTTPLLTFPHPTLTRIVGKPTNSSIKLLLKEVYANARAIPSTRGGGAHGHLGLVLSAADYLVLAHVAFELPAHPGATPVHTPNATAAQITEANRVYMATLQELNIATSVRNEIKQQIISAVDRLYIEALEDEDYGFADVTISAILNHLRTTYGTITRADLETTRRSIATVWNVDDPIENLWSRLKEIRRIATAGEEPLSNATVMELTFLMFEQTGVFQVACDTWRIKPAADKTYANFMEHFTEENKERLRKLTAAQAGFGANTATLELPPIPPAVTPPRQPSQAADANALASRSLMTPIQVGTVQMAYCWTHGLSTNTSHTSATCQRKADGHRDDATVTNMLGGNDRIRQGRPRHAATVATPQE